MGIHSAFQRVVTDSTDNVIVRLFRYGIVGGVAFVVDFGLLALLTEWAGLPYQLSAAISFLAGLVTNYLMSYKWVFNAQTAGNAEHIRDFVMFAIVGVIGLGLNALILWLFTEIVSIHYLLSKIISTVIVFFWNFFARQFIFSNTLFVCKINKLLHLPEKQQS